jgi:hypothetical protein
MISYPGQTGPGSTPCNHSRHDWTDTYYSGGSSIPIRSVLLSINDKAVQGCTYQRLGTMVELRRLRRQFHVSLRLPAHGGPVQFSSGGSSPHHYRMFSAGSNAYSPSQHPGGLFSGIQPRNNSAGEHLLSTQARFVNGHGHLNVQRLTRSISRVACLRCRVRGRNATLVVAPFWHHVSAAAITNWSVTTIFPRRR